MHPLRSEQLYNCELQLGWHDLTGKMNASASRFYHRGLADFRADDYVGNGGCKMGGSTVCWVWSDLQRILMKDLGIHVFAIGITKPSLVTSRILGKGSLWALSGGVYQIHLLRAQRYPRSSNHNRFWDSFEQSFDSNLRSCKLLCVMKARSF